ncbi:MAG: nucleotidyltransferase family protein [Candidatus Aenigmatarchaeota archaeon]
MPKSTRIENEKIKNDLEEIKRKILPILKKYKVKKAGLFGSVVRGEAKKRSDIDILVELPKRMSLFEMAGLKIELEKVLEKKVDLGEYSFIHPFLKDRILNEEVRIYEKR